MSLIYAQHRHLLIFGNFAEGFRRDSYIMSSTKSGTSSLASRIRNTKWNAYSTSWLNMIGYATTKLDRLESMLIDSQASDLGL